MPIMLFSKLATHDTNPCVKFDLAHKNKIILGILCAIISSILFIIVLCTGIIIILTEVKVEDVDFFKKLLPLVLIVFIISIILTLLFYGCTILFFLKKCIN